MSKISKSEYIEKLKWNKRLIKKNYDFLKSETEITSLSNLLKFLRRTLGLTQSEMAELLGMSRYTVHRYENNKKRITKTNAEYFAFRLGFPALEFIEILNKEKQKY